MGWRHLYDMHGPALDAADVSAPDVINAWRTLHRPCVEFWWALDAAFIAAIEDGVDTAVSCFEVVACGDGAVSIVLPSGRPIMYNEARVSYEPDKNGRLRPRASYLGTKSGREHVYGGKLAENAIQAMCRDLMAWAIVKAEAAGLRVVLHVHDEIVCEVPRGQAREAYAELKQIMTTLPEWADEFPIGAEGHTGVRYRK
jgi:DNA polymerase